MISQTVEYALRAVVTIAQHDGVPCTSQQISGITQVPAPYLSKLMQGLVRANIVASKRGLHGGFVLARDPESLTIWDVVDAVEPLKRIRECPLGIGSHQGTLCPLHRRLDNAMQLVEETFRETSVAHLLAQPGSVTPLCEEQPVVSIESPRRADTTRRAKASRAKAAMARKTGSQKSGSQKSGAKQSASKRASAKSSKLKRSKANAGKALVKGKGKKRVITKKRPAKPT